MKPVIVAGSELADGFRLAGIPVLELNAREEIESVIERLGSMEDVGLILVDERYMDWFEQAFQGKELPMIASFPSQRLERDRPYIDELTLRYLGQKLHIGGESE